MLLMFPMLHEREKKVTCLPASDLFPNLTVVNMWMYKPGHCSFGIILFSNFYFVFKKMIHSKVL